MKNTLILLTTLLISTCCLAQNKPIIIGFQDKERYDNEDILHTLYKGVTGIDSIQINGGYDAFGLENTDNKTYLSGFLHEYPKRYFAKNKPKYLGKKGKFVVVTLETGGYITLPLDTTDERIFVAYPPYYYFMISNAGLSERCNRFIVSDSTQDLLHNKPALIIKNILIGKKKVKK